LRIEVPGARVAGEAARAPSIQIARPFNAFCKTETDQARN